MQRLHRDTFYRLEIETWDVDLDVDGVYLGTERFVRGSSTPYPSYGEAQRAALQALTYGDWVRIEKFETPFPVSTQSEETK